MFPGGVWGLYWPGPGVADLAACLWGGGGKGLEVDEDVWVWVWVWAWVWA